MGGTMVLRWTGWFNVMVAIGPAVAYRQCFELSSWHNRMLTALRCQRYRVLALIVSVPSLIPALKSCL
jgi:hypothetical protein